jgi:hypothetical protein
MKNSQNLDSNGQTFADNTCDGLLSNQDKLQLNSSLLIEFILDGRAPSNKLGPVKAQQRQRLGLWRHDSSSQPK